MAEENKGTERVTFSRGYDVCIMAIDGTWRRDCVLNAISDTEAVLTVEGSIQGLNLKEFFLLLSSTGLAYRRCELVRVNGTEMDVSFLKGKNTKKRRVRSGYHDGVGRAIRLSRIVAVQAEIGQCAAGRPPPAVSPDVIGPCSKRRPRLSLASHARNAASARA